MTATTYDCIIIGSGPGGYVAAIRAAQLGLRTAVVEKESPGGVCLNWGCIPTKALLKSAEVYYELTHASQYGLSVSEVNVDFPAVIKRSRVVVDRMTKGVQFLLKKNKIDLLTGHGRLEQGNFVIVTNNEGQEEPYQYRNVILATGGHARILPSLPIDGERVITYRHALSMDNCPKKLLVVGAGAIGIEFAYFYNTFGAEVTVVEVLGQVLPTEDEEIAKALERSFKKAGIHIRTKTTVESLERKGGSVSALLKSDENIEQWSGDCCLVAIGIQGNIEGLGLENVEIQANNSFIEVDEFYRTITPNIYAIGDVTGPPLLAHVASHEGIIAAEYVANQDPRPLNYSQIPGCTYCQPQVASVGLTEKQATDKGYTVKIGKFPYTANGKAVALNKTEGMVKVVTDATTQEVLGVHILHAEATELIAEASIILSHEGIASSVFHTIHAHPTLSEAVMEAMGAVLDRPIHI